MQFTCALFVLTPLVYPTLTQEEQLVIHAMTKEQFNYVPLPFSDRKVQFIVALLALSPLVYCTSLTHEDQLVMTNE